MKRCYKPTKKTGSRITIAIEYATTHRVFAIEDKQFRAACEKASVEPTKRQAAKWRHKRGTAYASQ